MLLSSLLILIAGQAAAAPVNTSSTAIAAAEPLQISRGLQVMDRIGSPMGTVQDVDASSATLLVGTYKVRMPLSAFTSVAGVVTTQTTAADISQVMALSAAFQAQTRALGPTGGTAAK